MKGFDIFVSSDRAMSRLLKFLSKNNFREIKINEDEGKVLAEKRAGLFKKKDKYVFTVRSRSEGVSEIRVKVNPEVKGEENIRESREKADRTHSMLCNYF